MSFWEFKLKRRVRSFHRRVRELRMIAGGLVSTDHPVLVHLVSTRRCNLTCTYCNEYDRVSPRSPSKRSTGGSICWPASAPLVTISGGEPLLHPELDGQIARIRQRGMIAGMITNGYLLTAERIQQLNAAGSIICRSPSITSCRTMFRRRA